MFKAIKVTVFTSLITALVVNWIFYSTMKRPEIATVDILALTNQFIKKEVLKNHSNSEKKRAIKDFSHRLEEALNDLSTSKSLVLVPREAVIKGSYDYTKVLMNRLHLESKF